MFRLYCLLSGRDSKKVIKEEAVNHIKENFEIGELFPERRIRRHYIDRQIRDTALHPDVWLTQLRFYRMYKYLQKNYPQLFSSGSLVVDIGDSDGIFMMALKKRGISLNINLESATFINNNGMSAVCGNAECIPFKTDRFDFVFCFQMLEHTLNPLAVLNELGRICRGKIFLSIPNVETTNIHNIKYWIDLEMKGWEKTHVKNFDCHVFEFSPGDFKNLLSYTNLECETYFPLRYFDNRSFKYRMLNDYFGTYFVFFVLHPKGK